MDSETDSSSSEDEFVKMREEQLERNRREIEKVRRLASGLAKTDESSNKSKIKRKKKRKRYVNDFVPPRRSTRTSGRETPDYRVFRLFGNKSLKLSNDMKIVGTRRSARNAGREAPDYAVERERSPRLGDGKRQAVSYALYSSEEYSDNEIFEVSSSSSSSGVIVYEDVLHVDSRAPRMAKPSPTLTVIDDDDENVSGVSPLAQSGDRAAIKDVPLFVSKLNTTWKGKFFLPPAGSGAMKKTVMETAVDLSDEAYAGIKYNKYNGVQRFSNGTIVFVTFAKNDYTNAVSADGIVKFFASARANLDGFAMEHLVSKSGNVFLFTRAPGAAFFNCGKVTVVSANGREFGLRVSADVLASHKFRNTFSA